MGLQCGEPGLDPWVREEPLKKEMTTHSSTFAWRILWTEEPEAWWATVPGVEKSPTLLSDYVFKSHDET